MGKRHKANHSPRDLIWNDGPSPTQNETFQGQVQNQDLKKGDKKGQNREPWPGGLVIWSIVPLTKRLWV